MQQQFFTTNAIGAIQCEPGHVCMVAPAQPSYTVYLPPPIPNSTIALGYALLFVMLLNLLATLTSRRKTRVQLEDLKAKLQELADEVVVLQGQVGTLQAAVNSEIARVEDVIAKLKQGVIDPKDLEPLIATLQTSVDNLKLTGTSLDSARATLDGEQPAPAQAAGA